MRAHLDTAEPTNVTTANELGLPTVEVYGLDFVSDATIEEVAEALLDLTDDARRDWQCVVTPNVDHLVRYRRNEQEADLARTATVVLPDGMPVVAAGRLLRRPMRSRLTGADLFASLWPQLAADATPTVVVASDEVVAAALEAEHPGARCIRAPMLDLDDEATFEAFVDEIEATVLAHDAEFLFIGLAMAKHHAIAASLHRRWADVTHNVPVVCLIGASAEFHVGRAVRAPKWMQSAGLEWLHRLLGDPKRLARRYLVDGLTFVPVVVDEWRAQRVTRRGTPALPAAPVAAGRDEQLAA